MSTASLISEKRNRNKISTGFHFCQDVVTAWLHSDSPHLGAALAYYAIFAIAPLFLLTLSIADLWFGQQEARQELFNQISGLVGREGGKSIETLVLAANQPTAGVWGTIAALSTLITGATAVFVELQSALNNIWGVQPKPGHGVRDFIKNRVLSFGMVLGVGFLLLVSLIMNAFLSAFGKFASNPAAQQHIAWTIVNFLVSLGVVTLLFAMILKVLPDVAIAWRDVWMGAFVTALLFNLGKFLIGYYLGRSSMVSVYGAAGSFIILLLWVYYSAQILFLGAEFTRLYAKRHTHSEAG